MLKAYMDGRNDEDRSFFDLSEYTFEHEMKDAEVVKAFNQKFSTYRDDRNPKDVLLSIAKNSSWGKADIVLLAALSEADYRRIFVESEGKDLARIVRAALKFQEIQGTGPDEREYQNAP